LKITGDTVYYGLRFIEDHPSINEKQHLLQTFCEFPLFEKVLVFAYNPFIRYHLRSESLPYISEEGEEEFGEQDIKLLTMLNDRKLSGASARFEVTERLKTLSKSSRNLFLDILDKDLKCNIGVKLINKASPNLLPESVYMRCCLPKDVKDFKWKEAHVQEKVDGMYVSATCSPNGVVFMSRNGQMFPDNCLALTNLAAEIQSRVENRAVQLQGELLVESNGNTISRAAGNGILNSVLKGGQQDLDVTFKFIVWDILTYTELCAKRSDKPYKERFERVQRISKNAKHIAAVWTEVINSEEEAMDFFKKMLVANKEGAIVKEARAIWRNGTSLQQFKMKAERECELRVAGFSKGKGKNANTFGSLRCVSEDNELEVFVSGFTDEYRKYLYQHGDLLGKIITVKFNEVTDLKNGRKFSLFLPRFMALRLDKDRANTLLEILDL